MQHAWVPDIVGSGGTGRFRDDNFFLSAERPDRHTEEGYAVADQGRGALAANVLDLMGEDNAGLLSQQKRKVWDNKKKQYVTLQKVRCFPLVSIGPSHRVAAVSCSAGLSELRLQPK